MTIFRVLTLFLIGFSSPAAYAVEWQWGGRAFSNIYMPTEESLNSDTRALQQSNAIWLDTRAAVTEKHSFSIITELISQTRTPDQFNEDTRFRLREGYYSYFNEGVEWRVGRQINPWGKSDGINPTDYLTGKDRRRLTPDDEVRRTGADGVMFSYTPEKGRSPFNFTAVYNFSIKPSIFLLPLNSVPDIAQVEGVQPVRENLKNSEGAVKVSYFQPDWDISVSYFDGWNRLPQLQSDGFNSGILMIVPRLERIKATGFDFSKTLDQVILRAEAAYISRSPDFAKAVTTRSHYDAVLGVERPFGDKFRVQLQGLGRYFPKYESAEKATGASPALEVANEAVAEANERLQGAQARWRAGGTFRVSYGDQDSSFVPEVLTLYYPKTNEVFLRTKFLYRWTSNLQSDVGYEAYHGDNRTAFGLYEMFNSAFAEIRYLF